MAERTPSPAEHGYKLTVRCISCKAKKVIDRAEVERLSAADRIPMCDECFMPMVAERASI